MKKKLNKTALHRVVETTCSFGWDGELFFYTIQKKLCGVWWNVAKHDPDGKCLDEFEVDAFVRDALGFLPEYLLVTYPNDLSDRVRRALSKKITRLSRKLDPSE